MNLQDILAQFDQHERIGIEHPGTRKETLPGVVRFIRPAPGTSFITYSCLEESNADDIIKAQVEDFRARGLHFSWKVYGHDTPADLKDRLARHGLANDPNESGCLMVLDLRETPASLLQPVTLEIHKISHRQGIKDVIAVMEPVWGGKFGWMNERMGSHLSIPGYLSIYVGYLKRKPVCAAWTYYSAGSPFASLWGGSTVPEARGQGFYTQILATRVQEALARSRRFLYLDATPMSRAIVEKHGFQFVTTAEDFCM